ELGAAVELGAPQARTVRRTDAETLPKLQEVGGVELLERSDGALLAVFVSPYWLGRLENDHPDWALEPIVTS
ncbi:MAG: peptide chain release factor 3, partial [Acidimicrobiales bacterium]